MNSKETKPVERAFRIAFSLMLLLVSASPLYMRGQERISIPEEIEWTWEVRPTHVDPKLPNVLLLGDSITRNYYPGVVRLLGGRANVFLLATSASIGDPRLEDQIAEFSSMEAVPFSVVHFNNGMHGWAYTETQYKETFPDFLKAIRSAAPHASLIWATITPIKPDISTGATNPRIDARNAIAKSVMRGESITIDDQHDLMMHHLDLYKDSVHFNENGAEIQASQAVATIENALAGSSVHSGK